MSSFLCLCEELLDGPCPCNQVLSRACLRSLPNYKKASFTNYNTSNLSTDLKHDLTPKQQHLAFTWFAILACSGRATIIPNQMLMCNSGHKLNQPKKQSLTDSSHVRTARAARQMACASPIEECSNNAQRSAPLSAATSRKTLPSANARSHGKVTHP